MGGSKPQRPPQPAACTGRDARGWLPLRPVDKCQSVSAAPMFAHPPAYCSIAASRGRASHRITRQMQPGTGGRTAGPRPPRRNLLLVGIRPGTPTGTDLGAIFSLHLFSLVPILSGLLHVSRCPVCGECPAWSVEIPQLKQCPGGHARCQPAVPVPARSSLELERQSRPPLLGRRKPPYAVTNSSRGRAPGPQLPVPCLITVLAPHSPSATLRVPVEPLSTSRRSRISSIIIFNVQPTQRPQPLVHTKDAGNKAAQHSSAAKQSQRIITRFVLTRPSSKIKRSESPYPTTLPRPRHPPPTTDR